MQKHLPLTFLLVLTCIINALAQDTDSLYKEARKYAFSGERNKAKSIAKKAIDLSPNYLEIQVFLGRLYTWDEQYDTARYYYNNIINKQNDYLEAYSAWCDLELWSDNYAKALELSKLALKYDSTNSALLLRKAKAEVNLNKVAEAGETMNFALKYNHKDPLLFEYNELIKRKLQKNKISFSYDRDEFNKTFAPWNLYSIAYTRNTNAIGSLILRLNRADRFGTSGNQYELDAYPSLGEKMYMYLNVGVSDISIFPTYKWGASIYRSLPKSFEAELGIRYLQFSTSTIVYTASVGKYWKNFWFSLRPNFIPNSSGSSGSLTLSTRYYINDANNYIGVIVGSGISADEVRINRTDKNGNNSLLKSNRLRLTYQKPFKRNIIAGIGLGVSEEETSFSGFRTNYNFNFNIEKIF